MIVACVTNVCLFASHVLSRRRLMQFSCPLGQHTSSDVSQHAQLFLLVTVVCNWKCLIVCFSSAFTTPSDAYWPYYITPIILAILYKLFLVLMFICVKNICLFAFQVLSRRRLMPTDRLAKSERTASAAAHICHWSTPSFSRTKMSPVGFKEYLWPRCHQFEFL